MITRGKLDHLARRISSVENTAIEDMPSYDSGGDVHFAEVLKERYEQAKEANATKSHLGQGIYVYEMPYSSGALGFVFEKDHMAIGFMKLSSDFIKNKRYDMIGMPFLLPEYRSKGIGTLMYEHAISRAKYDILSDSSQTPESKRMWQKFQRDNRNVKVLDTYEGEELGVEQGQSGLEVKGGSLYGPSNSPHEVSKRYRLLLKVASSQFNLDDLSNQPTLDKMIEYCVKSGLEEIGDGSARIVFKLNENQVIKVAHTRPGVKQNKVEYETFGRGNGTIRRVITEVDLGNHDRIFRWIVCEKVEPYDFGAAAWADRQYEIASIFLRIDAGEMDEMGQEAISELKSLTDSKEQAFRDGVFALLNAGHDKDELISEMQMGVRKNGDLVFLDYGLDG